MTAIAYALLAAYCGLLLLAALQDLRSLRIANALSVGVLVAAVALLIIVVRPEAWWENAASFLILLAIGILLFTRGWMGGGDVKLAAAAASLFSLQQLVWFVVAATMIGGALTLFLLIGRGLVPAAVQAGWVGLRKGRAIPYGVAVAIGATLVAAAVIPVASAPKAKLVRITEHSRP